MPVRGAVEEPPHAIERLPLSATLRIFSGFIRPTLPHKAPKKLSECIEIMGRMSVAKATSNLLAWLGLPFEGRTPHLGRPERTAGNGAFRPLRVASAKVR